MKKPLLLSALLMLSGLAFGQPTVVPTCNSFNTAGDPIFSAVGFPDTNGTTSCTDYFGVGNWANSPLPAGTITGFTLINGGSGYDTPLVVINDLTNPTGSCASTGTLLGGGVVAGFGALTGTCTGYTLPQVTIVDVGPGGTLLAPTCGGAPPQHACGSGAMATAVISGPFSGGMLKFQDSFVDLKGHLATSEAVPTFAGSDYYEIALVQYAQKMHASLPPTTMRGYVQVPTGSSGCTAALAAAASASYLGPTIVAAKDKAVRVKFTNCLPAGAGGDLFIPADTTYMGAGKDAAGNTYTENRATLHLHGGATPWISDGTPHQWTVPAAENGASTPQKGLSVAYVPDMWFDASGAVIPSCAGLSSCGVAGATNNPGPGALTFYWTNQQGGRLMFYHDHAYGITRLNVYAGEAAGYLLYDPAEEAGLAAATAPGSITAGDLAHLIPIVIQDKTFVPSAAQTGAQDPTWVGNFGASALSALGSNGDLWFPHVYVPNQNPADPGLANGFGHWDYGAWFFPPQTTLTAANPPTAVTIPCTTAVFPGQILGPTTACPNCGCPITPNVSGTPEGFMDTPLVNGVAYPVLHVKPAAYRFKILAAGNDRSWNLSWFVADATPPPAGIAPNTEVAMLPAVPPFTGSALPLCAAINPVAVPALGLGLVTALTDLSGNPLNGTGLPANCWPNYGPLQGIPAPQTMWAADGRAGGAPDPRNAGPPWIQIGSEGGLLPAPVVIPATPVNYEQNTRSITIGSVAMHGLWLGPAERSDVIVDFSQFSGKTLILYNDAPAPAPAIDSRLDYFTGDGDQSPIGGAPNTPAGYGPNTRTIMQVVVDPVAGDNLVPFSLATLKASFASTATTPGLFASTQPTIIVPESTYNSAYNQTFPNTYMTISADTLTFSPMAPLNTEPCAPASAGCVNLDQKAIQELFTLDYGRMNATLGVELPLTNFQNQTTIPYGYVDWPTEIVKQGDTQLWKVTHNGVDSHFIHFHLFNVQVVNRVGWDGSLRQPDQNEVGWKDTVRMNPLEDILVALQPITPTFPFPLPDSIRPNDVTAPAGPDPNISGLSPTTANATVSNANQPLNFGWEYVWHCHILGHEENDMMRPIIFQVAPPAPSNLVAVYVLPAGPGVNLNWTDNSSSETSFTLQRADVTDPTFLNPTSFNIPVPRLSSPAYGGTITFTDPTAVFGTQYFYRVRADDDFTPVSPNPAPFIPAPLSSGWNTASITTSMIAPTVTFTGAPATAAYNTSFVVTATTNASTMPTVSAGLGSACTVGAVTGTPLSATATVTMTSGLGSCALTANWLADTTFFAANANQSTAATLATPTVSFTGAPATAPYQGTFVVTATTNAGVPPTITGNAVCSVGPVSLPGFPSATATVTMLTGTGSCTLTASWPAPAAPTYSSIGLTQTTTATKIAPAVTFNGAPSSKVYNTSFVVTATTNASTMPAITPTGVCTVGAVGGTPANASATVTMTSGTGTCVLTAAWLTDANYLAAGPINPTVSPTTAAKAATAISIPTHLPNASLVGEAVTVSANVTPVVPLTGGATPPTGSVTVTATTGETCTGSLSGVAGSCQLTFFFSGNRTMAEAYSGDANFLGIASAASTNQAVWDFALGVNPGTQTVNGGQKATYTLTVTSLGGMTGRAVNLTCSINQPAYTCTVGPASVTPNGGSKNATVTVNTVKGFQGTWTLTLTGTTTDATPFTLTHSINPTLTVNK